MLTVTLPADGKTTFKFQNTSINQNFSDLVDLINNSTITCDFKSFEWYIQKTKELEHIDTTDGPWSLGIKTDLVAGYYSYCEILIQKNCNATGEKNFKVHKYLMGKKEFSNDSNDFKILKSYFFLLMCFE